MTGFFGVPTRLFMKPEKPDFLRRTPMRGSFASSEYLLGLIIEFSVTRPPCDFSFIMEESFVKLWDCLRAGPLMRESVADLMSGAGALCRW